MSLRWRITLDRALVLGNSGRMSYEDARKLIVSGRVRLNNRKVTEPWYLLKGGHYFVKISGIGKYDFSVRRNTVVRYKEENRKGGDVKDG
jgi:ribosomal protein S4